MALVATDQATEQSEQRAKSLMIEALRGRGARFTRADAIVASGLPDAQAERALTVLLKEYRSHLSATETGELLYEFDPAFVRRDALSWRERSAAVGRTMWKAFTFLFKVTIVATLVGYFALFVAMMVAFIFARSNSSDDDDSGFGLDGLLWFWGWDTGASAFGRRRARLAARAPRVPFYKRVFAFVFGPQLPPADPLHDEKQIVAYIRAQRGRIAAVDLVRLMGWTFPRADEETTRLMAHYGGEAEVTEDGVIVYSFKELRKTAGAGDDRAPPSVWQRVEPLTPLTGNAAGTNTLIVFFNGFNLLAPLWIVPAFEMKMHVSLESWQFALTVFPMTFSALFFAIPGVRWLKARVTDRRRRWKEHRHHLLRRIFTGGGARAREELAPTPELGKVLDGELVSLGGDIAPEPDEQGRVQYTFPRIERETAAVAHARQLARGAERDAGAVVFSSAE
jgi:hypothetical protein